MGWLLYAGDDLYPHLRKTYYNRFGQLLFTQAQARFDRICKSLPAAPASTDDYGLPYEILKGYLITTVQNDKVSDASPAPILLSRWAEKPQCRSAEHATGAEAVRVLREGSEERQSVLVHRR